MKIVIITFALCALAVAVFARDVKDIQELLEWLDPDLKPHAKDCIDEMKLDKRLMDPEHAKEVTLPSVEVQSCFIDCLDRKMGLIKSDGSYNDSFVVMADDPVEIQERSKNGFDRAIKRCRDAVGTNPCKMAACFHRMPKNFWE